MFKGSKKNTTDIFCGSIWITLLHQLIQLDMVKRVEDEEVIRVLSRVMKIPKNKIKKDLKLGSIPEWDSLTHLNIYFEIQKVFKRKISMESAANVKSVKDWIKLINN